MEEIAEVYARALFEAANDSGVLDRVHEELAEIQERSEDRIEQNGAAPRHVGLVTMLFDTAAQPEPAGDRG